MPHVLLSSGGGDMYNALAGILRAAMRDEMLQEVTFHAVVGGFNRNAEELRKLVGEYPNICIHERVAHMAQLMRTCQAAVSAAGTMLFELSATQTPAVFFVSADNQQYDHEFFAQDGRMLYAGDIRADRDGCLENICGQLRLLLENKDMRDQMKRKLHEVTDGKGAQRIAEELLRL
jgi:spore coat polysaccharide biosynthesis predicted glycosyltransferase SpsG